MSNILKYVRHSVAGFVVWPNNLDALAHCDVGRALHHSRDVGYGFVMSAGFICWKDGLPFCYGRSDSLNMDSLPEDTSTLRAEWGMPLPAQALKSEVLL
jgi:hypothetical protein